MRMKQYLIAIALLTVSAGMMAQSKAGTWALLPKVGVTIANITNNDLRIADTDGILKSKSQAGYQVGLDVQYQCADNLALSLGAFYARSATDTMTTNCSCRLPERTNRRCTTTTPTSTPRCSMYRYR